MTEQPAIARLLGSPAGPSKEQRGLQKAELLTALQAFKRGDFSARLPVDLEGVDRKIADTFNEVIEMNQRMSRELARLSQVVGQEGKLSQRASMGQLYHSWEHSTHSVNALITSPPHP